MSVKSVVMWVGVTSIVDITEAKEMSSFSVSRSKVSRLLVADWHWKCGV